MLTAPAPNMRTGKNVLSEICSMRTGIGFSPVMRTGCLERVTGGTGGMYTILR